MYGIIARVLGSAQVRQMVGVYGKSSWTVFKRIGARNARRFVLGDSQKASFNAMGDAATRFGESVDTTQWIMQRIITQDMVKRGRNQLMQRTGAQSAWNSSAANFKLQTAKSRVAIKKQNRILDLKQEHFTRRDYPNLNMRTGELSGATINDRVRDVSRFVQLSALSPGSKSQHIAHYLAKGFLQQAAATEIFRYITENEDVAPLAWATSMVHNLDEIALPAGSARSNFAKSELLIQAFNMLSIQGGRFGYSRVNRLGLFLNLFSAARMRSVAPIRQYGTPAGFSRLAGGIAYRQLALATGEDDRQQQAYVTRAIKRQGNQGSGRMITIKIEGYTKSDGTQVRTHYRKVEAYN